MSLGKCLENNRENTNIIICILPFHLAASKAPSSVKAETATSELLRFAWDDLPCEYSNGLIQRYKYELETIENNGEYGDTENQTISFTPSHHFNVSYGYRFRVAAKNLAGYGPWSTWIHGSIYLHESGEYNWSKIIAK